MEPGNISQWGEVSKPKKTTKPKAKETTAAPTNNEWSTPTAAARARGGRAVSEGRGRGRATDRGGRGGRGRVAQASANGPRTKENQPLSVPTEESSAWTDEKPAEEPTAAQATTESSQSAAPQAKTWASMLRQTAAPKPAPKPAAPVQSEPAETQPVIESPAIETAPEPQPAAAEDETTPVVEQAVPAAPAAVVEPEVALSPSHDELTRTNLEQVVDDSKPPATHTAASTTADSWDPRQSTTATPLSAAQQQHQAQRQASSGFAASALKATTERAGRTPSYQRRVLDQEEAVRMPGNREVDRAAVQFGAFNLGGGEEDVDGEREEPETRAQPPADSPISQPRTSLPPVSQPGASAEAAQRAPGESSLASNLGEVIADNSVGQAPGPQGTVPSAQPIAPQSQQFSRFGQPGAQDGPQKPLDPFAQQVPTSQAPFDSFPGQTSQPPSQQPGGAFSSAPGDYSSYYTANDRNAYNSYYGHQYAQQQQGAHGQPDSAPGQPRGFGAYGASQQADNLSQYPQSGAGIQQRFGAGSDNQNSGHSTPNPTTQTQQQQQQAAGAPGSQPQSHAQQYPGYNHPYYNNPYYQHYYSNYGQGGFGPYGGGKGGMYGQPYGMSPNAPFDHQGSPASFAQSSLHREGGIGSSLDQYNRAGGAAGAGAGQAGAGAPGLGGAGNFGSAHDSFARGASSFQSQGFGSQGPSSNAAADDLKPFGEPKSGSGPSPSIGGARPGSAAAGNNAAGGQSGLPPPQSSQLGGNAYGGYPGHMQGLHGTNAYGMGGAGGANQHGSSPYGSYGQGGFGAGSGYYGGGQQQQRGGWGGNYH